MLVKELLFSEKLPKDEQNDVEANIAIKLGKLKAQKSVLRALRLTQVVCILSRWK
jgi:hypothetical protein